MIEQASALFKELDADGSGYLDMREVGQAASRLGFPFANSKEPSVRLCRRIHLATSIQAPDEAQ